MPHSKLPEDNNQGLVPSQKSACIRGGPQQMTAEWILLFPLCNYISYSFRWVRDLSEVTQVVIVGIKV